MINCIIYLITINLRIANKKNRLKKNEKQGICMIYTYGFCKLWCFFSTFDNSFNKW